MADLIISKSNYWNAANALLEQTYPLIVMQYENKKFAISSTNIILTVDEDADYFEIASNNKTFYKYSPGDSINSILLADAKEGYFTVLAVISEQ